jgi:hypothetical protein
VEAAYRTIGRDALRDPWDRFIVATALALEAPLVSRDAAIAVLGLSTSSGDRLTPREMARTGEVAISWGVACRGGVRQP